MILIKVIASIVMALIKINGTNIKHKKLTRIVIINNIKITVVVILYYAVLKEVKLVVVGETVRGLERDNLDLQMQVDNLRKLNDDYAMKYQTELEDKV